MALKYIKFLNISKVNETVFVNSMIKLIDSTSHHYITPAVVMINVYQKY